MNALTASSLGGRVRLGHWPTPLQPVESDARVYVKREDLCGFAFGGSKVRALEPLLARALRRNATGIVTGGRRDSNWAALAAIAAARLGLTCECVFDPGPTRPLAMGLAEQAGATIHIAPRAGAEAVNRAIAELVDRAGSAMVGVPRAGADPMGVLGYRGLAAEILDELPAGPVDIVIALGSGGACAGLLAGLAEILGEPGVDDVRVQAVPVAKSPARSVEAVEALLVSARAQGLTGIDPTAAMRRLRVLARVDTRARLAERAEASCGTLLDPVFGRPAWHTFCAQSQDDARATVLIASGGLPAFFDQLTGQPR